ncbi:MAG TPA: LysM peptidoglycan-binding domain-containing protein [Candidatus Acidoferrum sp.]|nr:LysM peptidoglycan-binding domain-containing protein [Candidatus Acidoferrum sp.]
MLLTDLNGPMSLQPRRPGLGRISRITRFAAPAIIFLSFASFGAIVSRAQDQQHQSIAEAARQERARKQELRKRAKHVYTGEDLKHPNILTPEDRAQVEAKRNECAQKNNCAPGASQHSPDVLDANSQHQQPSLGEIARQLRKQKELQALKPKRSEPFHLSMETPALASPILPERPSIRPPVQPALHSNMPAHVFRRDPFSAVPLRPHVPASPRPELAPDARGIIRSTPSRNVRTNIHKDARQSDGPYPPSNVPTDFHKDVRPNFHLHGQMIVPAPPNVFPRSAPPLFLVQPAQPVAPVVAVRPLQLRRALPATTDATQKTVSVRHGDSLWKLTRQILGRGSRWPELLAANRWIGNPNQIRAGARLNLPVAAATSVSTSEANGNVNPTIIVHKGDTLWNLAKTSLGRSSSWPCLAAANPAISDPNLIFENQELVIPSSCSP